MSSSASATSFTTETSGLGSTPFGPFTMRWAESGPPGARRFLLLHGIYAGAHSYEWRDLVPLLASQARVRVPDLLGAGESDRPDLDYTSDIVQAAIDRLIDDAGPNVHVVASSLTGAYALRSLARGVHAASLTLITPSGLGAKREQQRQRRSRMLYDTVRRTPAGGLLVEALTSRQSVTWFQKNRTYRDPTVLTDAEVVETRRAGRLSGAGHLQLAFVFGRLSIDVSTDDIKSVEPTVIWAGGQKFVAATEADRWAAGGARLVRVTSGFPQVEQPLLLAGLLLAPHS